MNLSEERLFKLVKSQNLDYLIGCSAGPDSIFLAHIIKKKHPNGHHHLVYCNHNMRPNEVATEKNAVISLGQQLNMPVHIINLKLSKKTQADFREGRVKKIIELAEKINLNHIAFGHHLDDDIETLMMQLLRGQTTNFRGIPHETTLNNTTILHPLLKVRKADILEYLKKNKINYCEDSSNLTLDYERNRIRKILLEFKKEPKFNSAAFLRTLSYLKENELSLIKKAIKLKEMMLALTKTFWIKKKYFTDVDNGTNLLKIFIQIIFSQQLNYDEVKKLNQALNSTVIKQIPLKNISLKTDYKWIQFTLPNKPVKLDINLNKGVNNLFLGQTCISEIDNIIDSNTNVLALTNNEFKELQVSTVSKSPIKIPRLKKEFRKHEISPLEQTFYPVFYINNEIYWIPKVYVKKTAGNVIITYNSLKKNYEKE